MSVSASARPGQTSSGLVRLAGVAWVVIAAAALVVWCAGIGPSYRFLEVPCKDETCALDGAITANDIRTLHALGVTSQAYAIYTLSLLNVVVLVWLGVALIIFIQRRRQFSALAISLILATVNLISVNGPLTALTLAHPALSPLNWIANAVGSAGYILLFFLFPDGRVAPKWTRWALGAGVLLTVISASLPPDSPVNADTGVWGAIGEIGFLALICAAIFSQVYRYRHATSATQRQQTKWGAFGLVVAGIGILLLNIAEAVAQAAGHAVSELIANTLFPLVLLAIPVSIGIAILRYRLYDIDVIINRTLVYGLLTALLGALYFGLIAGSQALIRLVAGQQTQSQVGIVLSTLLIAALFQPLRRRLQTAIDQRFYRRKYDAARTLAAFGATLRQEVELDELRARLLDVVEETMRPARVSLWLRPARSEEPQKTARLTTP